MSSSSRGVSDRDALEAALAHNRQMMVVRTLKEKMPVSITLSLAYQSIGIVFGDVGTSPLYVFSATFGQTLVEERDVIGALSLIFWTLTLSSIVKYLLVVLTCDDTGEGGTFAMYSLLCRHVRIGSVRNTYKEGQNISHNLSGFATEFDSSRSGLVDRLKSLLESQDWLKTIVLFFVLLGTCLVIGDGILTPAQSVLSAVEGFRYRTTNISQTGVVGISLGILVFTFAFQRWARVKAGFLFAPVVVLWLAVIASIGIWNLARNDAWRVFKAISPHYGIQYLVREKKAGWVSLGGIFLCITGLEAMFADLGQFSARSIQIGFTTYVYPCLLLAYAGQAAWLTDPVNRTMVESTFYKSIPQHHALYWPILILAIAAAVVASQASITATFSIVNQSVLLRCFPRVKVLQSAVGGSRKAGMYNVHKTQLFIPEVNLMMAVLCLVIAGVMGRQGIRTISSAYGIAVSGVMLITTILATLIIILVKNYRPITALAFFLFFFTFETVYLSANLYKFPSGGWVPLAIAAVLLLIMGIWRYGMSVKGKASANLHHSVEWAVDALKSERVTRVPGVGLYYSDSTHGIPAVFSRFIASIPAVPEYIVFVAVKHVEIPNVPPDERCLLRRLGPLESQMFRVVVRYGYQDVNKDQARTLADQLIDALALYIRTEDPADWLDEVPSSEGVAEGTLNGGDSLVLGFDDPKAKEIKGQQVEALNNSRDTAIIHIVGRTYMRAKDGNFIKKLFIDYAFWFLKSNSREGSGVFNLPPENILEVGMVYEV